MAQAVAAGIQSAPDCVAVLKAAETTTCDDLIAADAAILGSSVHMGSADWRIKKFIDSCCSGAWMKDAMTGKVGAVFATGSGFGNAGDGCELTMLGLLNNLAELGMIIIPLPKSTPDHTTGGLQWGPFGRSANPKMEPVGVTEDMRSVARHHGIHIARAAKAPKGVKIFG
jgi:NAD(P)H dehydrogenase (quinone)